MNYLECTFKGLEQGTHEILIALLAEMGFDTFDESSEDLIAYIRTSEYTPEIELEVKDLQGQFGFTMQVQNIAEKNWNEEWEKNFQAVVIDDSCVIKAPFHNLSESYPYEITIEPRMAFGTGHHPSTHLMIRAMMQLDMKNKQACDAGSGTGVLAIMAVLLGANYVYAIDNNEWAFNNALDNMALNNMVDEIEVELGELDMIQGKKFDIILANISRTIILDNLDLFRTVLHEDGILLVSGILTADMPMILSGASKAGFKLNKDYTEEDWSCALFTCPS